MTLSSSTPNLSNNRSSSTTSSTPWYELYNPEAHQSFRRREWPPPEPLRRQKSSKTDQRQRPWVMPLASSLDQFNSSRPLQAVRNARTLGSMTLPPLKRKYDVGDRDDGEGRDDEEERSEPATDNPTTEDHIPKSLLGNSNKELVVEDGNDEMIYFDENGLPRKSKQVIEEEEASMAQFEKAPRRQHFYALMDLSHEAHRERLHSSWTLIKNAFRKRPPVGVLVEKELILMLQKECQVSLSSDQLHSLMRQLPPELKLPNAYMSYYEFLEYFGELQEDGTVVEPKGVKQKTIDSDDVQRELTDLGIISVEEEEKVIQKEPTIPFKNMTVRLEGNGHRIDRMKLVEIHETNSSEVDASTATRFSTRVATEWDAYKAENDNEDDNEDDTGHQIDLSLNEVRHMSATFIQAATRGMLARKRTRIRRAMALCLRHDQAALRTIVRIWGEYTRNCWLLRKTCRRPLHRWWRYVNRLMRYRLVFRTCFWSFYVWRKMTSDTM
jgi:hypothetical protein